MFMKQISSWSLRLLSVAYRKNWRTARVALCKDNAIHLLLLHKFTSECLYGICKLKNKSKVVVLTTVIFSRRSFREAEEAPGSHSQEYNPLRTQRKRKLKVL